MIKLFVNSEEIGIKFRTFGGGERHLYITELPKHSEYNINIELYFENSNDIIDLLLLNNTLQNINDKIASKVLYCPYLPFSRQDRVTAINEPFSLKVITNLINSLAFDKVITVDNHSDVSSALLLNNINRNIYDSFFIRDIKQFILDKGYTTICSPDSGASKKIFNVVSNLNKDFNLDLKLVKADKVRDLISGEILETNLFGSVEGENILIIDDICDGGRTFTELSKVLYKHKANKVGLFISHGIFSRGKEVLYKANIKDIACIIDFEDIRKLNNKGE